MNCRHCGSPLELLVLDLGEAPPSNAYLSEALLAAPEPYYPLRLFACENCWLVQTEDFARPEELFKSDYAYFSSVSKGWLDHAARYARMITERLKLDRDSFVIEIASNDGYLLKNFVAAGIPCLGIEPTEGTSAVAENQGIPVLQEFFGGSLGRRLAREGKKADLIAGNNVFAHVPDINDFTAGLKAALKPRGTITLEFPHLMRLIAQGQFDTVYHEHFSYLSLYTVARIFQKAGLRVWDVEELPTHGGSLRVYGCHDSDPRVELPSVARVVAEEAARGMRSRGGYHELQQRADRIKADLLAFLVEQKREGKLVAGYGAAAKGNTLLNYAGVKSDLLTFVCDAAPSKQGKYLPGSHIPVLGPDHLHTAKPDLVLILPWNLASELAGQLEFIRQWNGKFVAAVPRLTVF